MIEHKPKIIVIAGATASGKTSLAIDVAKHFNGEVVSADSRQIYRKLNIGTAKVTPEEMDGVPHHLLNIRDVEENYSAVEFKKDATKVITELLARKRLPIIAGGTFFYVDTLLGKVSAATTKPNPELRAHLEDMSTELLYGELSNLDPVRATTIDPQNKRRLVRALEIVYDQGTVPEAVPADCPYDVLCIGLSVEKEILRTRFENRAKDWLRAGFKAEVESLLAEGISRDRLHEIGFEYSLMLEFIDGAISESEFTEKFIQKNWQYAKRQLTWLKRNKEIFWFSPEETDKVHHCISEFLS